MLKDKQLQKQDSKDSEMMELEKKPFSDRLDVYRYISQVHSRLKEDVGTDFVLSKNGDKDKKFIIEMTVNAYFVKHMVETMKLSLHDISKEEYEYKCKVIDLIAAKCFDHCMSKVYMVNILNRNVPKNYMLRLMSGLPDEEPEEKENEEKGSGGLVDWIGQKLGFKKKQEVTNETN